MTSKNERGCWLRDRCYKCGHRLRFASTGCPQCGEEFHGRDIKRFPESCECDRCEMARAEAATGREGTR
jgi:hypothetical protein